jgi:hypothetical protein
MLENVSVKKAMYFPKALVVLMWFKVIPELANRRYLIKADTVEIV